MKKKGYTLVELVGVVVLLAALLLIIIPAVSKTLKEGKQELLDGQIESIRQTLATWSLKNKPNKGEVIKLTLSQLQKEGLVEHAIKNPVTDEYMSNDMILTVTNNAGVITYEVLSDTGSCKFDYVDIPKIDIQGDMITYVEINSSYTDFGATATDKDGNVLNNLTSEGSVDTTKIGNYYITYNITKDGKCNSSIRTVIVRDTIAPVISFNDGLTISYDEINTYDFLVDVTVTDNSNQTPTIEVETNFSAIKGNYSIKYIATDASGNISTKLRKVTVK